LLNTGYVLPPSSGWRWRQWGPPKCWYATTSLQLPGHGHSIHVAAQCDLFQLWIQSQYCLIRHQLWRCYDVLDVHLKRCLTCNVCFIYLHRSAWSLEHTRVYPKVPGLAAWSENCKWYSSLPLGAVVSLFCESVWWVLSP
jgi:hypothetical protein